MDKVWFAHEHKRGDVVENEDYVYAYDQCSRPEEERYPERHSIQKDTAHAIIACLYQRYMPTKTNGSGFLYLDGSTAGSTRAFLRPSFGMTTSDLVAVTFAESTARVLVGLDRSHVICGSLDSVYRCYPMLRTDTMPLMFHLVYDDSMGLFDDDRAEQIGKVSSLLTDEAIFACTSYFGRWRGPGHFDDVAMYDTIPVAFAQQGFQTIMHIQYYYRRSGSGCPMMTSVFFVRRDSEPSTGDGRRFKNRIKILIKDAELPPRTPQNVYRVVDDYIAKRRYAQLCTQKPSS